MKNTLRAWSHALRSTVLTGLVARLFSVALFLAGAASASAALLALNEMNTWFGELTLSLARQITVGGLISSSVGLVFFRRPLVTYAGAFLAVTGLLASANSVPSVVGPQGLHQTNTTMIVWANVHHNIDAFSTLLDLAVSLEADVIATAETPIFGQTPNDISQKLHDTFPNIPRPGWDNGVMVWSRNAILHSMENRFTGQRRSVRSTIQTSDGSLDIVAVHVPSPLNPETRQRRNGQLRAAVQLASESGPAVLVGDLNAVAWSGDLNSILQRTALRRVNTGQAGTWLSRVPGVGLTIDHAFVSDGVKATARVGPSIGSDHWPIIIEVSEVSRSSEGQANEPVEASTPVVQAASRLTHRDHP
ncbi:MAG: endonuclease/exonuclease/phosphatase family protein [Pseudomonadota bacterium]